MTPEGFWTEGQEERTENDKPLKEMQKAFSQKFDSGIHVETWSRNGANSRQSLDVYAPVQF